MKKIYVGDENKRIRGKIRGVRGIERREGHFIFMFSDNSNANEAMKVLINSGYQFIGEEKDD